MMKSNEVHNICELSVSQLESVAGGGMVEFWLGVAANAVYEGIKGEVSGQGFVAQAVKTAKQKM